MKIITKSSRKSTRQTTTVMLMDTARMVLVSAVVSVDGELSVLPTPSGVTAVVAAVVAVVAAVVAVVAAVICIRFGRVVNPTVVGLHPAVLAIISAVVADVVDGVDVGVVAGGLVMVLKMMELGGGEVERPASSAAEVSVLSDVSVLSVNSVVSVVSPISLVSVKF